MERIFIIRESCKEMLESPWHTLTGRISHDSSEQLHEAFLHQLVSSLPENAHADPQDTVWGHTFAERKKRISANDGWQPASPNERADPEDLAELNKCGILEQFLWRQRSSGFGAGL